MSDYAPAAGPFSDWLRSRAEPLWSRMVAHRFTRDMASDMLPAEVLRRYLIYEHAFVETAVTIFGYVLVKAPSIAEQAKLVDMLRGLTTDQLDYFERVFARLGVSERMRADYDPPHAVLAFRDGMLGLAAHGGYEEIIGGMAAAEWMYLTWCREAHERRPRDPVSAEWIALHVAAPFVAQVDWLRGQLDRHGPALAPWRQRRVAQAFRRTLALEIDFHDAPYDVGAVEDGEAKEGERR